MPKVTYQDQQDPADQAGPADPSDPQLYARSFADVYDAWYGDTWYGDDGGAGDPAAIVAAFAERLPDLGRVLELGSGTGRLSTPLAAAGFTVLALDASVPMLQQDQAGSHRLAADMTAPAVRDASVDGVLIAYNTFLNLPDRSAQQSCIAEVSRVLKPGGLLAIDTFVAPTHGTDDFGLTIRDHPIVGNARLAIVTGPDPANPAVIVGSHIELAAATTCRPWRIAYCASDEMDQLAKRTDLELVERHDNWSRGAYVADSVRAVSWYRRR